MLIYLHMTCIYFKGRIFRGKKFSRFGGFSTRSTKFTSHEKNLCGQSVKLNSSEECYFYRTAKKTFFCDFLFFSSLHRSFLSFFLLTAQPVLNLDAIFNSGTKHIRIKYEQFVNPHNHRRIASVIRQLREYVN